MREGGVTTAIKERTIIVLLLVLLPLLSPLLELWSGAESYWFSPYLIWAGIIVAAYLLQRYVNRERPD